MKSKLLIFEIKDIMKKKLLLPLLFLFNFTSCEQTQPVMLPLKLISAIVEAKKLKLGIDAAKFDKLWAQIESNSSKIAFAELYEGIVECINMLEQNRNCGTEQRKAIEILTEFLNNIKRDCNIFPFNAVNFACPPCNPCVPKCSVAGCFTVTNGTPTANSGSNFTVTNVTGGNYRITFNRAFCLSVAVVARINPLLVSPQVLGVQGTPNGSTFVLTGIPAMGTYSVCFLATPIG